MSSTKKTKLGQFYTDNHGYILKSLWKNYINGTIVEPFVGNGDLIKYVKEMGFEGNLELYDLDSEYPNCIKRDTLLNPPDYNNKWVITNPPYLARNKNKTKTIYDKYDINDLYKAFIINLIDGNVNGGIIIIPLNFWSSIRENDCSLRNNFLSKYQIEHLNIFEESVFSDTNYTVCSFVFRKKDIVLNSQDINTTIYPYNININLSVDRKCKWLFGGEIYNIIPNKKIKVARLVENKENKGYFSTSILLHAIDSGTFDGKRISLEPDNELFYGKESSRGQATIISNIKLNEEQESILCDKFNDFFEEKREKTHSLFLVNYRESKEYARKRIPFNLAYLIINKILSDMTSGNLLNITQT